MAILDFPDSPQTGDQYTGDNGTAYVFDGIKWIGVSPTVGPTNSGSVDFGNIGAHVLPSIDNTYNLGSPSRRWNHIYVGPGSISVGDVVLSLNNGRLSSSTGFDLANSTNAPSATVAGSVDWANVTNKPTIPSLTGYATQTYVDTAVSNLVNSAPSALNTLSELATALGSDANFSTTVSTALGNRLRVDVNSQGLTTQQKSNAVTNLGLATVATSGSYTDLTNQPTIPTSFSSLVNSGHSFTLGSDGYLTGESLYLQGYLKGVDGSTGTTGQILTRQSNGGVAWADSTGGSGVSVTTGSTAPNSPSNGALWFDTASGRMYVYYDNSWIDASPVDGVGASTGVVRFSSNVVYTAAGQNLVINPSNDSNNKIVIPGQGNGGTFPLSLKNTEGDITLTADNHTWTFDAYGILNLPQNTDVGAAVIQPNDTTFGIKLISNGRTFAFGTDGTLTTPGKISLPHDFEVISGIGSLTLKPSDQNNLAYVKISYNSESADTASTELRSSGLVVITAIDTLHGNDSKDWVFRNTGLLDVPGDIRFNNNKSLSVNNTISDLEDTYRNNLAQLNDAFYLLWGVGSYPYGITLPLSWNSYDEFILLSPNTIPGTGVQINLTTIAYSVKTSYLIWQEAIANTKITVDAYGGFVFAGNSSLTLPNAAVIRQSTNIEVTAAETAYNTALANWEYARISDYLAQVNQSDSDSRTLEGWPFAGWTDVSGTTAPGYLALVNQAWAIQTAPSSPPQQLIFIPAISASLRTSLRTALQAVITTYTAWQALSKSVDIASGSQVLSLLGNGKLVVPDIIQNTVDEDLTVRTRYSVSSSPAGSNISANNDYTFGTNGYLTVPAGITGLVDDDLVIATRYTSALSGGGTAVVSNNFTFGTNGSLTFKDGSVILPSNSGNLEISAPNYIFLDSATNGQVMIGTGNSGPVVLGKAGQSVVVDGNFKLANGSDIRDTANRAIAFGKDAGQTSQGLYAVAIGPNAGQTSQGENATAVGSAAGYTGQATQATALGLHAGWSNQGASAIAVGAFAGDSSQHANSIILNATGSSLNSGGTSRFYVKPVRQVSGAVPSGFYPTYYNPTTGEFIVVTP